MQNRIINLQQEGSFSNRFADAQIRSSTERFGNSLLTGPKKANYVEAHGNWPKPRASSGLICRIRRFRGIASVAVDFDNAAAPVHGNPVSGPNSPRRSRHPHHRGDLVLPRDDRTVVQYPADFSDHRAHAPEERGPNPGRYPARPEPPPAPTFRTPRARE